MSEQLQTDLLSEAEEQETALSEKGAEGTPMEIEETLPSVEVPSADETDGTESISLPNASQELQEELELLRSNLAELRHEIGTHKQALLRAEQEFSEFQTLYPNTPLTSLTDDVWESVENGIPLAAAHALSQHKRQRLLEIAQRSNQTNAQRSTGRIEDGQKDDFSPAEVRAMTRSEVRKNFQNIIKSMQKWR